ncbi:MAG: gliding motility-associated C-terminal domain-containing protein [Gemmatimonadota bacterium]|nr:gliding motility-associated C-terminal domain-containing protein [Gemmatimonadota bacterium]
MSLTIPPNEVGSERLGFDQVLFEVPPSVGVELVDVTVGLASELEAEGGRIYPADELEVKTGVDSLWVRLPEVVRGPESQVVLRFSSVFYLASNVFLVSVGLGEEEEMVWQRVDATASGEGLTVLTPVAGGLVGDLEVVANPFTPNGDGINDAVKFVFPVFKMPGQTSLVLAVYGLDGVLVHRSKQSVTHAAGVHEVSWDGRDQGGVLLPPGLYICRVGPEVEAESIGESTVATVVASVY